MDIERSAELNTAEWSSLVSQDEAATFFHTPEWSDLLTSTLPGFEAAHLAASENGRLVGMMPVLARQKVAVTTLESMAFGTFGGPVLGDGAPEGAFGALTSEFVRSTSAVRVGLAQMVDRSLRAEARDLPGFELEEAAVQVVRLDSDYEELSSRFKPSARNKIRKAEKAGVTVKRAVGESDFLAYHAVLEECSRDWNIRPRPGRDFFTALAGLDPSTVQMWLAVHDGNVLGGDLNFVLHGTIMNWGNVSTDAAKSLAPNNMLHARAIEEGVRDGHHTYDLGSSGGIEGVRAFKASFGAVDAPVRRFTLEKSWYRGLKGLAGRKG